ncbi:hypothetical protein SCHIN_v1c08790 [Spiroplasma chinense]|uniref:Uncharacterized protein n=1 Tax=Spiroplasma chinense TaxID=216932 RepID=A0A5B9Y4R0_9MOLU|nr:hypothetical protein [Spiroplasma chinense]QEH62074.1 hypothetical protein SCHIN_v1c08790 [Spiroplasma chinense]
MFVKKTLNFKNLDTLNFVLWMTIIYSAIGVLCWTVFMICGTKGNKIKIMNTMLILTVLFGWWYLFCNGFLTKDNYKKQNKKVIKPIET